ncbi:MAG TPA: endonuclease/exonuclease/phosphatase family protein [Nannocystaceae bacterium]|nr:endonuclease/exonuclease/phosphatase family protein [Nannocystaceae bacterium]
MRPRSQTRVRAIVLVAMLVLAHAIARPVVRSGFGCGPVDGPDGSDAQLVVLSWNLRNFPGDEQDLDAIAARIDATAPHVLALQEIHDAHALAELLPDRTILRSWGGGARGQHVGVALDERTRLLDAPIEHDALALGGRVRPAFSTQLAVDGGLDFQIVVVHLKAAPEGAATRRIQWALLADAIARLRATSDDPDLVLVGDFNTTGDDTKSADDERRELVDVLARIGLRAVEIEGGCSAYWDGERHDGWLEPALLDLAFVAGFEEYEWRATPLGACAAHGCSALRSTAAHPDPQVAAMSDHCGVLLHARVATTLP